MWIAWVGGSVVALAAAAFLVLVVGMRTKNRTVLTAVRRMNRRFSNPRVLRTAGRKGASASVIRHVGRRSGKEYRTPIDVVDTGDALFVPLPYGTSADWLKNVLAAGSAEVESEGEVFSMGDFRVVSREEAMPHLSRGQRRAIRLFGVKDFLTARKVEATVSGDAR